MKAVSPEPSVILEFLQRLVPGASNRTLRQMLEQGRVQVNGDTCKNAKHLINTGDVISVGEPTASRHSLPAGVEVVFEDDDVLVILKPPGLLTVATEHEHDRTLYAHLRAYVKDRDSRKKVFVVHRLDKFVSGILVFAKSESVKSHLQGLFRRHNVQRKYWAIVEGRVPKERGVIRSHLAEDRSRRMHSTDDSSKGKLAVTHYRVIRRHKDVTALEVTLETGRKNQIRAHLSELGHPILGDRAYGSTMDPFKRIGLHAFCLGFEHPTRKVPVLFQSDPPTVFRRYL